MLRCHFLDHGLATVQRKIEMLRPHTAGGRERSVKHHSLRRPCKRLVASLDVALPRQDANAAPNCQASLLRRVKSVGVSHETRKQSKTSSSLPLIPAASLHKTTVAATVEGIAQKRFSDKRTGVIPQPNEHNRTTAHRAGKVAPAVDSVSSTATHRSLDNRTRKVPSPKVPASLANVPTVVNLPSGTPARERKTASRLPTSSKSIVLVAAKRPTTCREKSEGTSRKTAAVAAVSVSLRTTQQCGCREKNVNSATLRPCEQRVSADVQKKMRNTSLPLRGTRKKKPTALVPPESSILKGSTEHHQTRETAKRHRQVVTALAASREAFPQGTTHDSAPRSMNPKRLDPDQPPKPRALVINEQPEELSSTTDQPNQEQSSLARNQLPSVLSAGSLLFQPSTPCQLSKEEPVRQHVLRPTESRHFALMAAAAGSLYRQACCLPPMRDVTTARLQNGSLGRAQESTTFLKDPAKQNQEHNTTLPLLELRVDTTPQTTTSSSSELAFPVSQMNQTVKQLSPTVSSYPNEKVLLTEASPTKAAAFSSITGSQLVMPAAVAAERVILAAAVIPSTRNVSFNKCIDEMVSKPLDDPVGNLNAEEEHFTDVLLTSRSTTSCGEGQKSSCCTDSPLQSLPSKLLAARSKPEHTLIIWDWDDTFLPTYYLAIEHGCGIDGQQSIPEALAPYLRELEARAMKTLQISMRNSSTILITNASYRWLADSAMKYFPALWSFIREKRVKVLSARDICQHLNLVQTEWKRLLVRDQVEAFFKHLDVPASAVQEAVAAVKSLTLGPRLFEAFSIPSSMTSTSWTLDESKENTLSEFVDSSVPEAVKIDRFCRGIASILPVHLRLLAMTGLLLQTPSECRADASGFACTSLQQPSLDNCQRCHFLHPKRVGQSCCTLTTQDRAVLDVRIRRRSLEEAIARHRFVKGYDYHSSLLSYSSSSGESVDATTVDLFSARPLPPLPSSAVEHAAVSDSEIGTSVLHVTTQTRKHSLVIPSTPEGRLELPGGVLTTTYPYVIRPEGTIVHIKDMFPPPPTELSLMEVPCTVISIGDGESEREAALSAMAHWDMNHRDVVSGLTELRNYIYMQLFLPFLRYVEARFPMCSTNNGKRAPVNALCREDLQVLQAPSIAWTFKSVKLGSHPTVKELCRTHEALHVALPLLLKLDHSIDATISGAATPRSGREHQEIAQQTAACPSS